MKYGELEYAMDMHFVKKGVFDKEYFLDVLENYIDSNQDYIRPIRHNKRCNIGNKIWFALLNMGRDICNEHLCPTYHIVDFELPASPMDMQKYLMKYGYDSFKLLDKLVEQYERERECFRYA